MPQCWGKYLRGQGLTRPIRLRNEDWIDGRLWPTDQRCAPRRPDSFFRNHASIHTLMRLPGSQLAERHVGLDRPEGSGFPALKHARKKQKIEAESFGKFEFGSRKRGFIDTASFSFSTHYCWFPVKPASSSRGFHAWLTEMSQLPGTTMVHEITFLASNIETT